MSGYRLAEVKSTEGCRHPSTLADRPERSAPKGGARADGSAAAQVGEATRKAAQEAQKGRLRVRGGYPESRFSTFVKELRYHKLTQLRLKSGLRHDKPGRPAKDAAPRKV